MSASNQHSELQGALRLARSLDDDSSPPSWRPPRAMVGKIARALLALEEQLEAVDQALRRMEWQIKSVLPEDRIDTFLSTLLGDIVQLRAHVSSPAKERNDG